MCGICGFVKYDENRINCEDERIIRNMNKTLLHRGPDDQKELLFDDVAFGFSRLSIIGLEDGMQPLYNEDKSIVVICNGEIFNYIELRKELKQKGHMFKTSTDIEVLVHLYEEYGINFLNLLNGQFAFALYDKNRKLLFCTRDHLGIIPFFYTFVNNTFIFGSEIKAILEHPFVKREVDVVGLDQVFSFAGLISPRTLFKDISSLENGHFLTVNSQGTITDREYWDLIFEEGEIHSNGHTEEYYVERLEDLLDKSIKLRLRSDVPLGFYLSGGLDSSMIAMKINEFLPDVKKEAFSIDFVESQISETKYQELVAEKSNSRLNKKTFRYNDISERLRQVVYHCECPLKETYNTASLSLSNSVRNRGVKVILSGEGADEFFAGYVGYRFDKIRAMNPMQHHVSEMDKKYREQVWGDGSFFYENDFSELDRLKGTLYSNNILSSFDKINCLNHFVIDPLKIKGRNILNKRSYIDYKLRLVDHLVSDHGDRMALANSIEVRYPFLDKELVEFSTKVPSDLKLRDLNEKYILKKIAADFVPKPIIEREKFGFVAPGSPYLLQRNIEYINDLLSYDQIKKQGFFNPDTIELLKKRYKQDGFSINVPFESDLLITVITFGILLDNFFRN